jgi:asparagine synthetase A
MKFFSLLIGCLLTFCTLKAQDSTVCIPNHVARWFLEQNDIKQLLLRDAEIKDQIVANLRETLNTKDKIINSYKTDSLLYNSIIVTNRKQINLLYKDIEIAEKEARKQKRLKNLALIGIGIVSIIGLL